MDLSQPFGASVNDFIPNGKFGMSYVRVDDAVEMVLRRGKRALMAKVDVENAFRNVPVRPKDWPLLGFEWRGVGAYFHDVVLAFGLQSGLFLFDQFAKVLEWIFVKCTANRDIIHYLDDFFICGGPATGECF